MSASDDERRDFADRLRKMPLDTGVQHGLLAISRAMYPENRERFEHEFGHGTSSSKRDFLADLIDRPTCHMDLTETIVTVYGEICIWKCSVCGQECEEINGVYEYCPHCGAEVLDGTVDSSD